MIKFSLLFLSLLVATAPWAFAQNKQDGNRKIIVELCGKNYDENKTGTGVVVGDWKKVGAEYCIQVQCDEKKDDGNWSKVSRNKCISEDEYRRVIIGVINGDVSGAQSGAQSGSQSGAQSGSQSGSQSGAQSGSQSGSQSGAQSGSQSGVQSGAQSGSQSGVQGGADAGGVRCEYVMSGVLPSGHACLKYCKKHWLTGKEGEERKKCRECVEKYSTENGGDLVVDWSKIPGGKPNKYTVKVTGVQVRTGEVICYDVKTGAVVSRYNTPTSTSGTAHVCPHGSSTVPGGVVVPGGTTTTTTSPGSVVINTTTTGTGGLPLPSFCQTGKKRDQKKCDAWLTNNARFQCASSGSAAGCMGHDHMNDVQSRYYGDCVNCGGGGRKRDNSWIGDALTGLFVSAGGVASSYINGQAYVKGQEAWAGAQAAGFEQCQIHNNNYLQYTVAQELPALSPAEQAAMGCNGFQVNQYAGMGNGMMGAWNGAGYSNGYLGGMMGPYGGYNPYGQGGMVGGAVGGMYVGGMQGGYPGGYAAGMQGGYVAGMQGGYVAGMQGGIVGGLINGAVQGGMAAGYPGGYAQGGYAGGYPGGYAAGMQGGYPGGYAAGMQGGYPGGYAQGGFQGGGLVNGISIAGGFNSGMQGGYAQGGYAQGGYAGGYPGGYAQGGYAQGGYAQGGYAQGGYAQGGYAQGGYAQGGYAQGGYAGGYNPGGWGSGTVQSNPQLNNYDSMLGAQGVAYQMGMAGGGYGGGGYGGGGYGGGYSGGAGFNPMNAGFTFNAGYGGGW